MSYFFEYKQLGKWCPAVSEDHPHEKKVSGPLPPMRNIQELPEKFSHFPLEVLAQMYGGKDELAG